MTRQRLTALQNQCVYLLGNWTLTFGRMAEWLKAPDYESGAC